MLREPAPFSDSVTLAKLTTLLRRIRPEIVHCGTPKACLVGGLAARFAGVPARVITLHGMRADGLSGRKRDLMLFLERLSCRSAQRIYCVGESLRSRAVELGLAPESKLRVLGAGTANGIDVERFSRSPSLLERSEALRERLGLPADAPVVGFVGRLVRDKGVAELITAFGELKRSFPNLVLLLVGPLEDYDGLDPGLRTRITTDPQIVHTGFLEDTAAVYPLMTLLALPTYREGFPYVPMEAAAMALPVVATRVTGCVDAVVDGVTGTLVPPRDVAALAGAVADYLKDSLLCQTARPGRPRARGTRVPARADLAIALRGIPRTSARIAAGSRACQSVLPHHLCAVTGRPTNRQAGDCRVRPFAPRSRTESISPRLI